MSDEAEFERCRCGSWEFYRSRSRNRREKIFRMLLPIYYCRCHTCGWRGARINRESWSDWRKRMATVVLPIIFAAILIVTLFITATSGVKDVFSPTPKVQKKK